MNLFSLFKIDETFAYFKFNETITLMYSSFLGITVFTHPRFDDKIGFRIFICSIWFVFLVIRTGYKGNLIAFMTYPGFEPPIDTPKQQYERGIQFAMYDYGTPVNEGYFTSSSNFYLREIVKDVVYLDLIKVFQDISDSKITYGDLLSNSYAIWNVALDYTSKIHLSKHTWFIDYSSWIFPKNTFFGQCAYEGVLRIESGGFKQYWERTTYLKMRNDEINKY